MPFDSHILSVFLAGGAMALACALLSVFVVARHWGFIGEGISHSGFAGAGTAWMVALWFPTFEAPHWMFAFVAIACIGTALCIGLLTRRQRVTSDAAIGIFLVASLAWGGVGQQLWTFYRKSSPAGFDGLLFGAMKAVTPEYAIAAVAVAGAIAGILWLLRKELLAYCLDPELAESSGVRVGFIHYLLHILLAATVLIGIRITGSVLVTALLVLPASAANLLTQRLGRTFVISILIALVGAWGGLALNNIPGFMRALPSGSLIVLVLFVEFMVALGLSKMVDSSSHLL